MRAAWIDAWLVTLLDIFGGPKPLGFIERGEHDRVRRELRPWEADTCA